MNDAIDIEAVAALSAIGRPVRRKEDQRLLTGKGRFTDDFNMMGQAYAVMVRSPYPHARILKIDMEPARRMPGVLGVFSGRDCLADGLSPIPHSPVPSTRYDLKLTGPGGSTIFIGPQPLLPVDKVRHVGEAVAMVVAETLPQALDAAETVEIEYGELRWVASSESALSPGAPLVWDEAPDNVLVDTMFGDSEVTDRAFAAADHVVEMDLHIGRVTGVPLEPRAALGQYDPGSGRYTLYAGSGGPVRQKTELAAVLGVDPARVRVLSYDVGGNFGVRNRVFVEFGLVLWAARKLGRPVKYTATRSEAFLSDFQGRDLLTKVALALRADGCFLAMRADNVSNVGGRCVSLSPLGKGSALVTGNYDIPAASLRSRAAFTNTMPTNAYRSSGRPEVTYAIERLVDKAARELGFDRVQLRRKNLVVQQMMPYPNAVGARYDSGTYEANMDLAMRNADWGGFCGASPRSRGVRQAARVGASELCRIFDWSAKRAHRDHGNTDGPGRGRYRHRTQRPGSRNEFFASRLGAARRAGRGHRSSHRRHRSRQPRRRLAFRPVDAARRNLVRYGGAGADWQRESHSCRHPRNHNRRCRLRRRPFLSAAQQSQR